MVVIDFVGFAASGCIVLSLTMRSMLPLRIIGLVGALTFVAYGVLLGAWPVVLTNVATSSIQIFHLRRLLFGGGADGNPATGSNPSILAVASVPAGVDPSWPPPVVRPKPMSPHRPGEFQVPSQPALTAHH